MKIWDVIEFKENNHQMVWQHPAEDFNTGSVLIVREGQVAIFYKDGIASDPIGPGRYKLSTQNIPVLRKILQIPTDGVSTFKCFVYFVNMVEAMNLHWGLTSKAEWMDPVYGIPVKVGVSGTASLRITNPTTLVREIVAAEGNLTAETLVEYFKGRISKVAKGNIGKVARKGDADGPYDVFRLNEVLENFSEQLHMRLNQDFASYGFQLHMFDIYEFVLPEDDPQFIRVRRAISERSTGIVEMQTDRMKSNIASTAAAESEMIRAEGHARSLNMLGTSSITERQLDIAENMSKNQSMNQYSGMVGSMAMMSGAMNLGVQASQAMGSAMSAGMNGMGNSMMNGGMMNGSMMNGVGGSMMNGAMNGIGSSMMNGMNGSAMNGGMNGAMGGDMTGMSGGMNGNVQQQAQPAQQSVKKCVSCGAEIPFSFKFCPHCGTTQPRLCPSCGSELPDNFKFCPHCGAKV